MKILTVDLSSVLDLDCKIKESKYLNSTQLSLRHLPELRAMDSSAEIKSSSKEPDQSSEVKSVNPLTSLETHIFRCGIQKFSDLFQNQMFTYEYVCGRDLSGEQIDIWFDIGPAVTKYPKSCAKKFENLEIKGGVKKYTKFPISLSVTPRLLNTDGTVYRICRERIINLRKERRLKWEDEVLDVDVLKKTDTFVQENECTFEFQCVLSLSGTSENDVSVNCVDTPFQQRKQLSLSESESSNGIGIKRTMGNRPSAVDSLKKIKLDSMQVKLTTDLKTVLESQDQADVTFVVKGEKLKGHRIILSARSKTLAVMLSDDNKVDGAWSVVIDDVDDPSVMKIVLEYIYTGKIEDDWRTCADQLLLVASRWELHELVEYLDLNIPELFTIDNSSVYLQLAKRFQLKNMEEEMTKFFLKNRDAIVKTPGFEELREKNPAALVDWLLAKS